MCFQNDLVNLAVEQCHAKKADSLLGRIYYEFVFKGKRIGIIQSGIGAPMATLILERLIVRGVERVISTGIAGALRNEGIDPGDLVLCTKAVRNEGTSYHLPEAVKVFLPRQAISKRNRRCAQKRKKCLIIKDQQSALMDHINFQ
jgi:uridine phosphorylase